MKRIVSFLKLALWIGAAVVTLLWLVLNTEFGLRHCVEPALEAALETPVSIGSLSVSLTGRIEAHDIRVLSEQIPFEVDAKEHEAGFGSDPHVTTNCTETLFSLDALQCELMPLALLRGRLDFHLLKLVHPQTNARLDGAWNWVGLPDSVVDTVEVLAEATSGVDELELTDGELLLDGEGEEHAFSRISLFASNLHAGAAGSARIAAEVESWREEERKPGITSHATPAPEAEQAEWYVRGLFATQFELQFGAGLVPEKVVSRGGCTNLTFIAPALGSNFVAALNLQVDIDPQRRAAEGTAQLRIHPAHDARVQALSRAASDEMLDVQASGNVSLHERRGSAGLSAAMRGDLISQLLELKPDAADAAGLLRLQVRGEIDTEAKQGSAEITVKGDALRLAAGAEPVGVRVNSSARMNAETQQLTVSNLTASVLQSGLPCASLDLSAPTTVLLDETALSASTNSAPQHPQARLNLKVNGLDLRPLAELISFAQERADSGQVVKSTEDENRPLLKAAAASEKELARWDLSSGFLDAQGTVEVHENGRQLEFKTGGNARDLVLDFQSHPAAQKAVTAQREGRLNFIAAGRMRGLDSAQIDSIQVRFFNGGMKINKSSVNALKKSALGASADAALSGSGSWNLNAKVGQMKLAFDSSAPWLMNWFPLSDLRATAGKMHTEIVYRAVNATNSSTAITARCSDLRGTLPAARGAKPTVLGPLSFSLTLPVQHCGNIARVNPSVATFQLQNKTVCETRFSGLWNLIDQRGDGRVTLSITDPAFVSLLLGEPAPANKTRTSKDDWRSRLDLALQNAASSRGKLGKNATPSIQLQADCAELNWTGEQFLWERLKLDLTPGQRGNNFICSGDMNLSGDIPQFRIKASGTALDFSQAGRFFLSAFSGESTPPASASKSTPITLTPPRVRVSLDLQSDGIRLGSLLLRDFKSVVEGTPQSFSIAPLRTRILNSNATASGILNLKLQSRSSARAGTLAVDLQSSAVPLASVALFLSDDLRAAFPGSGSFTLQAEGNNATLKTWLRTADGNTALQLQNVALQKIGGVHEEFEKAGRTIGSPDLCEGVLDSANIAALLQSGTLTLPPDNAIISGPAMRVRLAGNLALKTDELNLAVRLALSRAAVNRTGLLSALIKMSASGSTESWIELPGIASVYGTLSDPEVAVSRSATRLESIFRRSDSAHFLLPPMKKN